MRLPAAVSTAARRCVLIRPSRSFSAALRRFPAASVSCLNAMSGLTVSVSGCPLSAVKHDAASHCREKNRQYNPRKKQEIRTALRRNLPVHGSKAIFVFCGRFFL
jgi:hypothetical protein